MFTCPERDIHSIYLDNELPAAYIKEYEAHIQSCAKCRKELERIKKLRTLFQNDCISLNLDKTVLEQSFSRLQSRMSFKKVTELSKEESKHSFKLVKYTVPAAAAAAVLALIVPLRLQKTASPAQDNSITPLIAKRTPAPVSETNVVINGNISHDALLKLFNKNAPTASNVQYVDAAGVVQNPVKKMSEALAAVDIFRPEFSDSNTIQIRITIPTAENIPVHLYNSIQSDQ